MTAVECWRFSIHSCGFEAEWGICGNPDCTEETMRRTWTDLPAAQQCDGIARVHDGVEIRCTATVSPRFRKGTTVCTGRHIGGSDEGPRAEEGNSNEKQEDHTQQDGAAVTG